MKIRDSMMIFYCVDCRKHKHALLPHATRCECACIQGSAHLVIDGGCEAPEFLNDEEFERAVQCEKSVENIRKRLQELNNETLCN